MYFDEFLALHPVFRRGELENFLSTRDGSSKKDSISSLLDYHQKQGHILQVRRGLYSAIPRGATAEKWLVNPFMIGARLADDAVLAFHTALAIHGYAHSVTNRVFVSTCSRSEVFTFQNVDYKKTMVPRALRRRGLELMGVETINREGLDMAVTGLERTVVDCVHRPGLAGGWEELWLSMEGIPYLDLDFIVDYVRCLENATTASKMGFLLESQQERWMVEEGYLEQLQQLRPGSAHYIDRDRSSRFSSRWNLMIPEELWDGFAGHLQ